MTLQTLSGRAAGGENKPQGSVANPAHCPLCTGQHTAQFAQAARRDYLICQTCALVWLQPDQRPSLTEERAEYALHENDPADARYRKHLQKLTAPLLARLPQGMKTGPGSAALGLDFGSGPGPTISVMLGEQGFDVTNYDPAFAPDKSLLGRRYDFITCTEAAEHFHNPAREFALLARLLKPGGVIGLMTSLRLPGPSTAETDFANWYYIRERSHVCFYAPQTMHWIAVRHGWQAEIISAELVILQAKRAQN